MTRANQLAALSDTHGRLARVESVAKFLVERRVSTVIHCGDISSPDIVEALAAFDVHWVLGNCDWDDENLRAAMARCGHTCHGVRGEVDIDERKIAFTHGHRPGVFDALTTSREYDLVLHGHTHHARDELVNGTRVICPGALHAASPSGFVILELPTLTVEWIELV